MVLTGYGFIKEVISGDTLVIIGQPKGSAPPELKLTLASLKAPRLALKPTTMSSTHLSTQDQEPFAWQSREFLRKLCIGKQVFFKVEYTVESIGRHFGAVYLIEKSESDLFVGPSKHQMSENICLTIAREGWCSVRSRSKEGDTERSGDLEEMILLSKQAEETQKGKFNKDGAKDSIRTVKWDFKSSKESEGESDVMQLFKKIKNKPQRAIVEYIRDGSSLKALLLDSMTLITFNLAGVQCPRMNGSSPQEHASEAKFFTEVRLLNREVNLKVGGVNEKYTTFFGTVMHPKNSMNLAIELVRNGLAQAADWSMSFITPSAAAGIHQAVLGAKKAKRRIWRNYTPPTIPGDKAYVGIVSEINSGDSFTVRVGTQEALELHPWLCEEKKIHLSSVRAPRLNRREDNEPYAKEAKEYLRTKLIGKKVSVDVEYAIGTENEDKNKVRKYGTVLLLNNQPINIAAALLEQGYATLMSHKQGAERSNFYHELIEAESKAQEKKVGVWNSEKDTKEETRIVEINSPALAKAHLSNLKGEKYDKRLNGVVEYVFNGGRVKLFVPSQNVTLVFNLSGIQCARTGKQKAKGEDNMFGEEALAFTRSQVLHRNVEFLVESVDKGGNFLGTIYLKTSFNASKDNSAYGKKSGSRENLSVLLLRFGFAKTNAIGIRYAKFADILLREEAEAKESKAGLWLTYVEPVVVEEKTDEEEVVQSNNKKMVQLAVSVCHINSANDFFVHIDAEKPRFEKIEKYLETLTETHGTKPSETEETFKKNELVVALYDDGSRPKWYRASITGVEKEEEKVLYTIRYLDYGNSETVEANRLKKLTNEDITKVSALAHPTSLAFAKAPTLSEDCGREAAMYLSQLTRGKTLQAYIHSKEKGGSLIVSLLPAGKSKDKDTEEEEILTINGLLLKEGLATVPRKVKQYLRGSAGDHEKRVLKYCKEQQEEAHTRHSNLWAYGDPREDEE